MIWAYRIDPLAFVGAFEDDGRLARAADPAFARLWARLAETPVEVTRPGREPGTTQQEVLPLARAGLSAVAAELFGHGYELREPPAEEVDAVFEEYEERFGPVDFPYVTLPPAGKERVAEVLSRALRTGRPAQAAELYDRFQGLLPTDPGAML